MDAVSSAAGMTRKTAATGMPEPLCALVGHVGSREAVTIVAAVIDMHPSQFFTPADLSNHLRDVTRGFEVWTPTPQVVDGYCRHALTSGGVVEPVTATSTSRRMLGHPVRAYQSRGTRQVRRWRLRVYDALASWGLRHPTMSVQQMIGPPRGAGGGRITPAHLRLPMYQVLLRNPGQFIDYRDLNQHLTAVVASDQVSQTRVHQTIWALAANKILVSRPSSRQPVAREVAIAQPWVGPISDLLSSLAVAHRSDDDDRSPGSCEPAPEVLDTPDAIADLVDKTQRWSSFIIGQHQGTTVTKNDIYEIIRCRPDPTSPSDIVDTLTRAGRPITRSRVSAYLRGLVQTDEITALPGAGHPGPGTPKGDPHGYVVTPTPPAQSSTNSPRRNNASTEQRDQGTSTRPAHATATTPPPPVAEGDNGGLDMHAADPGTGNRAGPPWIAGNAGGRGRRAGSGAQRR